MSVQFGRWNLDGRPLSAAYIDRVNKQLVRYAPDGGDSYSKEGVNILFHAFHTNSESRYEKQPHLSGHGEVLTWNGRLDNRADLIQELSSSALAKNSTDLSVVFAAYERWKTNCFAKLVGDWVVSIFNPVEQSLILAKDVVGTRHCYYATWLDKIVWSTALDPLVALFEGKLTLAEEYIAGWLSSFPATHLTPYAEISSVPPSCFVRLTPAGCTITKYWDFNPANRVYYSKDAGYEEHFRDVFATSVRRRLRSDRPVLAELSGGMDSSSIVCMADDIIAGGSSEPPPRLDTVSYYSESEPSWNELPYFSKVEERRGRSGCHIDISSEDSGGWDLSCERFALNPSSFSRNSQADRQLAVCMKSQENRVVLSGIGGDEVTGGFPSPLPELADLLAKGQLKLLARQLKAWALSKRKPWFHLLFGVLCRFLPLMLCGVPPALRPAPWLSPSFVRRHRHALLGYERRLEIFHSLPSFQESISNFDAVRRQLACFIIPPEPPHERRYPFLDRDLLEFLFAVPREQLVRPGERRSLMRRALVGIVPEEIRLRRRKAFMSRQPLKLINSTVAPITGDAFFSACAGTGWFEMEHLTDLLASAKCGQQVPLVPLSRMVSLELWLRGLRSLENSENTSFANSLLAVQHNAD